jgi:3-oxoacyl-[acyl-carrier protein] reductase
VCVVTKGAINDGAASTQANGLFGAFPILSGCAAVVIHGKRAADDRLWGGKEERRMHFTGRRELVTGGSSGIGAATCRLLAREGAAIAIGYCRGEESARALCEELRAQGAQAMAVKADVTERDQVKKMVDEVHAVLGKIDLLVHGAGNILGRAPILEETGDLWQRTLDLNLNSVLWVTQAVLPDMIGQRWGRIVTISSRAGRDGGSPGVGAYAVSKAGVMALTKVMAKEYGPHNINANCVVPGWIDTPFHVKAGSGELQRFADGMPLKRIGTAEEVASVIVFLLSDAAKYVTGAMVDVNGGLLMP